MTLRPTTKRLGCVVDAAGNVVLRWEGERNVLVARLSPEAAARLADALRRTAAEAEAGEWDGEPG